MNARQRFLAACRAQAVDATPVWFMRQAGRYLPEYRELRRRHSILELAKTPHLATEVALQPLRRFDLDAAILFADIVLPLQPMGVEVDLPDNVGPLVAQPVRTRQDVDRLTPINAAHDLDFVMQTIQNLRQELAGERALIGFSGAPFTLASYLIEGRPSRDFVETKRFMHAQPQAWDHLMTLLSQAVSDYLAAQVRAGVDAVQVFDSWAGNLSPDDYRNKVAPYTRRIFDVLRPLRVPTIHFATPTAGLLRETIGAGGDVVGVDWRMRLSEARAVAGRPIVLQGNLDPIVLATSQEASLEAATRILDEAKGAEGHIFNLGHGIVPQTPPENVQAVVDHVHAQSRRRLQEAAA